MHTYIVVLIRKEFPEIACVLKTYDTYCSTEKAGFLFPFFCFESIKKKEIMERMKTAPNFEYSKKKNTKKSKKKIENLFRSITF